MTVLAGIALKATVVLLLACALALSLRRASAALRHLVWAAAVCGVLVLPAASFLLPEWSVAEFPAVIPSPGFEANDVEDGRQGETSRKTVETKTVETGTARENGPCSELESAYGTTALRLSLTFLLDASPRRGSTRSELRE